MTQQGCTMILYYNKQIIIWQEKSFLDQAADSEVVVFNILILLTKETTKYTTQTPKAEITWYLVGAGLFLFFLLDDTNAEESESGKAIWAAVASMPTGVPKSMYMNKPNTLYRKRSWCRCLWSHLWPFALGWNRRAHRRTFVWIPLLLGWPAIARALELRDRERAQMLRKNLVFNTHALL